MELRCHTMGERFFIPVYKNKKDIQSSTSYYSIELMSHTMQLRIGMLKYHLRILQSW